jgi:hypothetical protein
VGTSVASFLDFGVGFRGCIPQVVRDSIVTPSIQLAMIL